MTSAFKTRQVLKCFFCDQTIEAVPATLRGNRYRRREWYTNGEHDTDIVFALCPEHQEKRHHDDAWAWVEEQQWAAVKA